MSARTNPISAGSPIKPGEQLQQARLQQRLSLEQVCDELKLSRTILKALETDDYSQPLGQGYWRGHLRRYAQYLGLEPEPLVEALEQQGIMTPIGLKQTERLGVFSRTRRPRLGAPRLTLLALVLALIAWFWVGPGQEQLRSWVRDTPLAVLEDYLPSLGAKAHPPRIELPVPIVNATQEEVNIIPPQEAEIDDEEEAVQPEAPTLDQRLNLSFKEECWVTVADGSGKVLLSGLKQKGENVLLLGVPPFKLVLGNVAHVALSREGVAVDLSQYSHQKVVRLSLD